MANMFYKLPLGLALGLILVLFSSAVWFYLESDRPFNPLVGVDTSQFKTIRSEVQRGFFYSHDLDRNSSNPDERSTANTSLD